MPRKVSRCEGLTQRWNFFVNPINKSEFILALAKNGKSRCQSAALRAFMYLYTTDSEVADKINAIVDDFIVYKGDNNISKL